MSELYFFLIVALIVAGVWGFFLLNFAGNSRRFLKDDILRADEKQSEEAKSTLRNVHLMTPVWVIAVGAVVLFFVNAIHPFLQFSVVGVALIIGGLFFAYLGWAISRMIRGDADEHNKKDAQFFSKAFLLSFGIPGILIAVIGVLVCSFPTLF